MSIDVGARLRELKKERLYSFKEIAEKTGFSPGYISNVHQGKTVGIENLEKICTAIGITLAQFFQADVKPVDLSVLEAISGLSDEKKKQLALFINGLSDKP